MRQLSSHFCKTDIPQGWLEIVATLGTDEVCVLGKVALRPLVANTTSSGYRLNIYQRIGTQHIHPVFRGN